jgi:hypothetical protein
VDPEVEGEAEGECVGEGETVGEVVAVAETDMETVAVAEGVAGTQTGGSALSTGPIAP